MSPEDKVALRRGLRGARRDFVATLDEDARARAFDPAGGAIEALIGRARTVAVYVAMGDEADPSAIAAAARAAGATLCLPRLGEEGTMDFVISDLDIAALVTGPLRIPQPGPDASIIEPDLIVAPLLGFDRAMGRIGQGKGYYDRAFVAHPDAFRLGLAWSAQEAPTIPMEPWDMRLHAVLTEREWIGAAR